MRNKARPATHLLGEPSSGPYEVVRQPTLSSAQLRDPATREMVDKGASIPLEQILLGLRRSTLEFEPSKEGRSIGQMIAGTDRPEGAPPEVRATGWQPGKRKRWIGLRRGQVVAYQPDAGRELRVGYVLHNDTANDCVEVHSCRSTWMGCA